MKALQLKKQGKIVVLDTFWISNKPYIRPLVKKGFERKCLEELAELDEKFFDWPDVVIYLDASSNIIKAGF